MLNKKRGQKFHPLGGDAHSPWGSLRRGLPTSKFLFVCFDTVVPAQLPKRIEASLYKNGMNTMLDTPKKVDYSAPPRHCVSSVRAT